MLQDLIDRHFKEDSTVIDGKKIPLYQCKMCRTYVKGTRRKTHLSAKHHVYFKRLEERQYENNK